MEVIHLNEKEFCQMILCWYAAEKQNNPDFNTFENTILQHYIAVAQHHFPIVWREENGNFIRPV